MFRTLRSRHLVASLVVFVAMLGLLLWNAQRQMQHALQARFDEERNVVSPLLVAALGPLLAARDYASIDDLVRENARNGHLEFIEVTDARGRSLARAGQPGAGAGNVATAPVTLAGQTFGEVRFVLRTDALATALERLRFNSLVIGLAVLVAGTTLLALSMVGLAREFRGLSQASRRIAEGDYATRLPDSRVLELQTVATAFNHMAQAVQVQLGALRDQQAFMRDVLDTLSEGYVIVDRDNRVIDCNETFYSLHGMRRPPSLPVQAPPITARLFLPDGQALPDEERSTRKVLATGQPQRDILIRIERDDAASTWVSVNASPLYRSDEPLPYAALSTLTDVTRHVAAERALRTANESLEQRVRLRTLELERARDEAQAANQAKSEFLSRMSHELRTPLNAILGFTQLLALEGRRFTEPDQAKLGQIEAAGWHLLALINDVLDLARIEAGEMSTSAEAVELHALVAESVPLVQAQAEARGIGLITPASPPDGTWVRADRRRLKQVLVNLLSNAVKYNRDGGRVSVEIAPAQDGRVVLSVHDSGRGFEPAQIERLYQPFTRFVAAEDTTEGTGIGLVITRRLVELMQGRLALRSEAGVGSVFSVELPAGEAPLTAEASPGAAPPEAARPALAPLRVLYVEDNPSNVELLQQIFGLRRAWALEVANDGLSGLVRVARGGIDGAIVDIDLPGIDGVELCRRLKAEPATAGVPLLALSANAMPDDIRRALAAGFAAYLSKPVNVSQLLVELERLLSSAGPRTLT